MFRETNNLYHKYSCQGTTVSILMAFSIMKERTLRFKRRLAGAMAVVGEEGGRKVTRVRSELKYAAEQVHKDVGRIVCFR